MNSSLKLGDDLPFSTLWGLNNEAHWPSKKKYSEALEEIFLDETTTSIDILATWLNLRRMKQIGLLKTRQQTRILVVAPTGMIRSEAEDLVHESAIRSDLRARQLQAGLEEVFPHLKLIRLVRGANDRYLILGSSNPTYHGLESNWEANVLLPVQKIRDGERLWELFDWLWNKSKDLIPDSFGVSPPQHENLSPRNLLAFQEECYSTLEGIYIAKPTNNGAILSLPTGSGKTIIATRFLLNKVLTDVSRHVLWVAPHGELLDQAYETFMDQQHFKHPQVTIAEYKRSTNGSRRESQANVEFMTLQAASQSGPPWKEFDCLVVDEAHWGAANSCEMLPGLIKKSGSAFRLGLTATPYRRCIEEICELMSRFFEGNMGNLIEKDLDYIAKQTDAQGRSVLAKERSESINTKFSVKLNQDYYSVLEFEKNALEEFNKPERNKIISKSWVEAKHGRTLVFAVSIHHANELAKVFKKDHSDKRIQVVHTGQVPRPLALELVVKPSIDHKFSREDRRQIRERFQSEEIDILISVDLYIMGVDFPKVHTLFMTRPTLSPVLYAQMKGRGLRGPAFGGTEEVIIVDFADQIKAHNQLNKHIIKAVMNYAKEKDHDEFLKKQKRKWTKRIETNLVSELLGADIGKAVYWVKTKGDRKTIRSLECTQNLRSSLRRGLDNKQNPISRQHHVYYVEPRDGESPSDVANQLKPIFKIIEFRNDPPPKN